MSGFATSNLGEAFVTMHKNTAAQRLLLLVTCYGHLVLPAVVCAALQGSPSCGELRALANGPFILDWQKQVGAIAQPKATQQFFVNDFQATPDGRTLCTKQIQQAIDACTDAGGGNVEFHPGDYVTGSLFLKSNVNLHLAKGVRLLGAQEAEDFPIIHTRAGGIETDWPAAMLNVRNQQNVSITGEGTIDARGKRWWDRFWAAVPEYERKGLRWAVDYDIGRPHLVQIYQSHDVTVQGVTLMNSPFWTLHVVFSQHVTVDGVTICNNVAATNSPSTDGINVDSSAFVLVQNCDVDCNDDNYCFKAGMNADGLRVNIPAQYSLFRNCVARRGQGVITFGSDMSGGIHHVEAVGMKGIGTDNGIRFKSAAIRGGVVEDVFIHDVQLENVGTAIEMVLNWYPQFSYPKLPADADRHPADVARDCRTSACGKSNAPVPRCHNRRCEGHWGQDRHRRRRLAAVASGTISS